MELLKVLKLVSFSDLVFLTIYSPICTKYLLKHSEITPCSSDSLLSNVNLNGRLVDDRFV